MALKNKNQKGKVEDLYAKEIAQDTSQKESIKSSNVWMIVAIVAGLAAAPSIGGASSAGSSVGITVIGLTMGDVTIAMSELSIHLADEPNILEYGY